MSRRVVAVTLAVLHDFVRHQDDARSFTLDHVHGFLERVMVRRDADAPPPDPGICLLPSASEPPVDIVEAIAGVTLRRRYDLSAPKGVNGRNSDNALIVKMLGWEPSISLRDGMERTYRWIYDEIKAGRSKDSAVNRS